MSKFKRRGVGRRKKLSATVVIIFIAIPVFKILSFKDDLMGCSFIRDVPFILICNFENEGELLRCPNIYM